WTTFPLLSLKVSPEVVTVRSSISQDTSDLSENPEVAYLLAKEASLFNSPNTPSMECPFIIKEFRYAHSLVLLKKYDAARRHYINALDKLKSIDYKRTLQTKVLEKELLIAKSDLKILSSQSD
ncbi:MAG: hypothetical protein KC652_24810, partial [Cyanobacteria bacterium HKST-UBA01]|nr:hypothetical protein [Cyanobacteria bacterium HKST-UBA01]